MAISQLMISSQIKSNSDGNSNNKLNPKAPEFTPTSNGFHFPPPFVFWYTYFPSPRYLKPYFPHLYKHRLAMAVPEPALLPSATKPPPEKTVHPVEEGVVARQFRRSSRRRFSSGGRSWVEKWPAKTVPVDLTVDDNPVPVACYPFGDSTSLMIRHIPVRLRRRELMELLDEHCREENEKLKPESQEPCSEFDFLYLPIDFRRSGNYGYAFVNFTTWEGAARLYNSWTGFKWENCPYKTQKICQISRAKFQGKEALKKKFERSVFICGDDQYLPIEITPARNGRNGNTTTLITIGTRVSRAMNKP